MTRLIDADALKESIDEHVYLVHHGFNETEYGCTQYGIHQIIDEQPTIDTEPHWIPCSEVLPKDDTEVLISYRYKEGEGDTDHVNIDITSYGAVCFGGREIHTLKEWRQPFDYFHANYEVIAWMPLPKPYEVKE